jgi:hypothetical protein
VARNFATVADLPEGLPLREIDRLLSTPLQRAYHEPKSDES